MAKGVDQDFGGRAGRGRVLVRVITLRLSIGSGAFGGIRLECMI
jgi:hypothetical protein